MRRAAAIALVLASLVAEAGPRFKRFCGRTRDGVTKRGLLCDSLAAFELAPANGAGMGTSCACTAVTSAQGGAVTWGRTSVGWCSKRGETLTGIAVGDVVACGAGTPRVEPLVDGTLALRVESSRTQLLLRTENFANPAWTNTVTVTADTDTSPANGANADTLDDTSGAASQSSSQAYIVAGTNAYTGSVFVKAGTLTAMRLTVSGSGGGFNTCTVSGLSTTTWTRATCTVTATTNVTLTIQPGTVDADTGTIKVWGGGLETGAKATSYVQADSISFVRQPDTQTIAPALAMVPSSWAVTAEGINAPASGNRQLWAGINATYVRGWVNGSGNVEADRDAPTISATNGAASASMRVAGRYVTNGASATVQACTNGSCGSVTTSNSTTAATSATATFGYNSALGYYIDGLIGRICNDPDPTRCI